MDARARFEALYRAYAGAVRAYARRRSDAQTADDVVADVFVVAWRRLDDVPEDPLPWLLGVARRVLANRRRGAARDARLRARLRVERIGAGAADLVPAAFDEAIVCALGALRERDREVLLLIGWEGLTSAQAARVLGVRPNTFAVRLRRARRRFERALSAEVRPPDRAMVKGEVVQ